MMEFKKYMQVQEAGLAQTMQKRLKPKGIGRNIGRMLMGAVPFAGTVSDVIYLIRDIMTGAKQNKDMSAAIAQLMKTDDSKRAPGTKNVFDLDDTIENILSDQAIVQIAHLTQEEMKKYNFDYDQMPENMVNMLAVRYIHTLTDKYRT